MILLIIGLSLSFIAIGVLFYLGYQKNKQIENRLNNSNKALLALQKEFTQYQVDESRVKEKDVARIEIRHDNIAKSIQKNEQMIDAVNKRIPDEVKKCIKHIELSR